MDEIGIRLPTFSELQPTVATAAPDAPSTFRKSRRFTPVDPDWLLIRSIPQAV